MEDLNKIEQISRIRYVDIDGFKELELVFNRAVKSLLQDQQNFQFELLNHILDLVRDQKIEIQSIQDLILVIDKIVGSIQSHNIEQTREEILSWVLQNKENLTLLNMFNILLLEKIIDLSNKNALINEFSQLARSSNVINDSLLTQIKAICKELYILHVINDLLNSSLQIAFEREGGRISIWDLIAKRNVDDEVIKILEGKIQSIMYILYKNEFSRFFSTQHYKISCILRDILGNVILSGDDQQLYKYTDQLAEHIVACCINPHISSIKPFFMSFKDDGFNTNFFNKLQNCEIKTLLKGEEEISIDPTLPLLFCKDSDFKVTNEYTLNLDKIEAIIKSTIFLAQFITFKGMEEFFIAKHGGVFRAGINVFPDALKNVFRFNIEMMRELKNS